MRLLMLEKPKLSFDLGSISIRANIQPSEKEIKKYPRDFFQLLLSGWFLGIDDSDFILFEQSETHKQPKEKKTFWQQPLKTFYPLGLNGKEEYLY